MKINFDTYGALTTQQRILVAVDAAKRNDSKEIERLIATIPPTGESYSLGHILSEIDGCTADLPSDDGKQDN